MENLADKKKAILESTLELIKENGFHGTPMSLVAKQAGVAAGTIYHYFDSKDTLICQLFQYLRNQLLAVVRNSDVPGKPYQERFYDLWKSLCSFYTGNPNVLVFFEQFINSPYNKKRLEAGPDPFHQLIFSFLEEGVESGYLRPVNPEILGVLLHGSIVSTAKTYKFGNVQLGEADLEQIRQILWDGMAAKKNC
ncbi:TetR/AcrR family transcriptional regulator [Botryobacter ruber]|uniref:TetR/AcrR family transcriptional regulator n=1 Tax=Botryobacter ruber TaxID=2171629 RepID=UPI000E0AD873|nr:TetR/AcrR family transcriptional regulator [Botryobacter ruber]